MRHEKRQCTVKLHAVVTVGNAVKTVFHGSCKSEKLRGLLTVCLVGSTCKSSAAERTIIHSFRSVLKSSEVSQEHPHICHKMMCEGYRLGTLEMCISRHDCLGMLLRKLYESFNKLLYKTVNLANLITEIESEVNRNLIVS